MVARSLVVNAEGNTLQREAGVLERGGPENHYSDFWDRGFEYFSLRQLGYAALDKMRRGFPSVSKIMYALLK